MKHWPVGTYCVLTHKCKRQGEDPDVDLVFLGYKYNCCKVLLFLITKDAGSTKPDPLNPYIAKFPDSHGNVCQRAVPRPACISMFFDSSNVIDSHNHKRQFELALEKHWIVKSAGGCWFRLATTGIGMNVVDAKVRPLELTLSIINLF